MPNRDKPWDGNTERRHNPTDHDNLIRVIAILAEHVKNFDNHILDDKNALKKLDWANKMIYIGLGAIGTLQFVAIFIKH